MLEDLSSMLQTNGLLVKDYSLAIIFESHRTILSEAYKVTGARCRCFRNC